MNSATLEPDELHALRAVIEGTAGETGEPFFQALARHLAIATKTDYAFVAEFSGVGSQVRTLAYCHRDRILSNVEFDVTGTPCEDVVKGQLCHYPNEVWRRFPEDEALKTMGIESYLGVPLRDVQGRHLGHLAVFGSDPMPHEPRKVFIFRIFAARAAAELERLRAEKRVKESEERYRDLYENAPIAYVAFDREGRLQDANRRAAQLLGRDAENLIGSTFDKHIAPNPTSAGKAAEIASALREGREIVDCELELSRPDGQPRWIQFQLKPQRGADGEAQGGRSIWIDITERVRAESEKNQLLQQNLYLLGELKSAQRLGDVVGRSMSLTRVMDNVRRVAPTDTTVLITGETGVGKERIARAIHEASRRSQKPLIKINCAAIPGGLVESELFGHEKGAFTGAVARRIGRFELAHGGTLFLDEVGELSLEAQAKLLRALQEREIERVGGTAPIRVDVRVLAATNRDLLQATRDKSFREDLFYRLNVFPIPIPPLRERAEDVRPLVESIVPKLAERMGKPIEGVSEATLKRLESYRWPGNVRELENVLERAVILAVGPALEIPADALSLGPSHGSNPVPDADPPPADANGLDPGPKPIATLENAERDLIREALVRASGVIEGANGAAKILGLHPNTLRSRMKRLGIDRKA